MADTQYSASSGFFDSVSSDRLYYASDMNKPYHRLVSEGVFGTDQTTAGTDLAVTPSSGMVVTVAAGEGIFGGRWFSSDAQSVTIASNTTLLPRIDSIIVQVDTRSSVRASFIVYRTGTPASSPVHPTINDTTGVYEFRIADIYVAAAASEISASNITDCRGSSECPIVHALIEQADTSALWDQYHAAYQEYFDETTTAFEAYIAAKQASFEEFMEQLTEDITASMNLQVLHNRITATAGTTSYNYGISSYDSSTDKIVIYINGLLAVEGVHYTASTSTFTLASAIPAGQYIDVLCYKAVVSAAVSGISEQIEQLDTTFTALTQDSGWTDMTIQSGSGTAKNRKVGKTGFVSGTLTGISSTGVIASVGASLLPTQDHYYSSVAYNGTACIAVTLLLDTSGDISLAATSSTLTSSHNIVLDTTFAVG